MAQGKKNRDQKARNKADDEDVPDSWATGIPLSPPWWAPVFVTLLIIGLVWLVVYYFTGSQYPIPGIKWGNLVIGIVLMMSGFLMTLRWR